MSGTCKTKYALTIQASNHTLGHLSQKNENVYPQKKKLYINVHSSFICNNSKIKTKENSIHVLQRVKLWHSHTVKYYSAMRRNKWLEHATNWISKALCLVKSQPRIVTYWVILFKWHSWNNKTIGWKQIGGCQAKGGGFIYKRVAGGGSLLWKSSVPC